MTKEAGMTKLECPTFNCCPRCSVSLGLPDHHAGRTRSAEESAASPVLSHRARRSRSTASLLRVACLEDQVRRFIKRGSPGSLGRLRAGLSSRMREGIRPAGILFARGSFVRAIFRR